MTEQQLTPDAKGRASLILGEVLVQTRENFPDPRFRPKVYVDTEQYHICAIDPSPYQVWVTADGIGTKPELAERLVIATTKHSVDGKPNYNRFGNLAFDTFAMIDGDEARFGRQLLGIAHIIDMNTADHEAIFWISVGSRDACNMGRFALLNGETAELGYRISGYGQTRLNWNAVGVSLVIPEKLILGSKLEPGQPLVAFKETSIRSNGLTMARHILESAWLNERGYKDKQDYVLSHLSDYIESAISKDYHCDFLSKIGLRTIAKAITQPAFMEVMNRIAGHDLMEQILVPWHVPYEMVLYDLLEPSTLYGKVINEAQGWTDNRKQVEITGAAHITGGGIPEKVGRMVKPYSLGAEAEAVFPEPKAIAKLLDIAPDLTDEEACAQWNRGIGFVIATKDKGNANRLIKIAEGLGYEAAEAGKITDKREVKFRGHTWTY